MARSGHTSEAERLRSDGGLDGESRRRAGMDTGSGPHTWRNQPPVTRKRRTRDAAVWEVSGQEFDLEHAKSEMPLSHPITRRRGS